MKSYDKIRKEVKEQIKTKEISNPFTDETMTLKDWKEINQKIRKELKNMMNKLNDVHVSYSQGKQSRRVTYVWHQHVPSCIFHQYDPHTGQMVRLDIYTPNNKKRKRTATKGIKIYD